MKRTSILLFTFIVFSLSNIQISSAFDFGARDLDLAPSNTRVQRDLSSATQFRPQITQPAAMPEQVQLALPSMVEQEEDGIQTIKRLLARLEKTVEEKKRTRLFFNALHITRQLIAQLDQLLDSRSFSMRLRTAFEDFATGVAKILDEEEMDPTIITYYQAQDIKAECYKFETLLKKIRVKNEEVKTLVLRIVQNLNKDLLDTTLLPAATYRQRALQHARRFARVAEEKLEYATEHPIDASRKLWAGVFATWAVYQGYKRMIRKPERVMAMFGEAKSDVGKALSFIKRLATTWSVREAFYFTFVKEVKGLNKKVTFDEIIVGTNTVGDKSTIAPLKEWFKKLALTIKGGGIKIMDPQGIILYGPPGVGKTLLVSAFAREAEPNVIARSTQNLRYPSTRKNLISKAGKKPTLIFFDEIDKTDSKDLDGLLSLMSGAESIEGKEIFVIGTANDRIAGWDDPLLSRFEIVEFPLPSVVDRRAMLDYYITLNFQDKHYKRLPSITDQFLRKLSDLTQGMGNRDIAKIVNIAFRDAYLKENVGADDLMKSTIKVIQTHLQFDRYSYEGESDQARKYLQQENITIPKRPRQKKKYSTESTTRRSEEDPDSDDES